MKKKWVDTVSKVDFAFQPIVNVHSGICFGVEALIRGVSDAGFDSIGAFFDEAYYENALFPMDMLLRRKAIEKFCTINSHPNLKLFYNIDNRVTCMPDYIPGTSAEMIKAKGLPESSICYEISEKHEFNASIEIKQILDSYRSQGYKIAVDDFGSGFSGLQILYHVEPDYIKIDRFFITDIQKDSRKKLFVSTVLNLAHILGIQVIAEGVETKEEFYVCKEIGCDYVQGHLIQRPTQNCAEINYVHQIVQELNRNDKRKDGSDISIIKREMHFLDPLKIPLHNIKSLFEAFKNNKQVGFLPVVNFNDEPLGIVREIDIKEYVYSPYGRDLLMNHNSGKSLQTLLKKCPVSDINNSVETILEIYSVGKNTEGIVITENSKYLGFLSTSAIIALVNEKNIADARDQNPLTRLPGNNSINEYLGKALSDDSVSHYFVYFDFDNFKPFNDVYGFRVGDRAILMFSEMLRSFAKQFGLYIGHIGGDDFFAGAKSDNSDKEKISNIAKGIIEKFSDDVRSLYNFEDREKNYITTVGRNGEIKNFPLLGVSIAVLFVRNNVKFEKAGLFDSVISELKKKAKSSEEHIAWYDM
jgi:EAL domain-containing protein (putative c-di-GMP-specific phosphodiesterase class I)/GGDEF domain-containing protein